MPPGTGSVISTSTSVATVPSVSSEEWKSLKNFEVDEDYVKDIEKAFEGTNLKNCDFHLISAPIGFPTERLKDIPLNSTRPYDVEIEDEDWKYICDNKTPNTIVFKVLPLPSGSNFTCAMIKSTCSVRKSMRKEKIDGKNFLPRPQPRPMSEGLIERFKPFGWQRPGEKSDFVELKHKESKTSTSSSVKKTESPPKRHKKRKLNDASPLLLDGTPKFSADSDSETIKFQPKRKRKLSLTKESPVPILEPFVVLNSETPPKKKKIKAPSEDQNLENSGICDDDDVASEQDKSRKKLKKKKSKKHKKEKKVKKDRSDKQKNKKQQLISQ